MQKTLLALVIAASISTVQAGTDECNYSLDFDINISDEQMEFTKKDGDKLLFKGEQLLVNGKLLELTDEQMTASLALQSETKAIIPKVAIIAVEGAELGVKAATIALTGVFGDSEKVHQDLIQPIEALSEKIKQNITATSINTKELEQAFDEDFDAEIEKLVEKAISQYSGKLMAEIMLALFSGDDKAMDDFEFRMENMEKDIEQYVEKHAVALEQKADALCVDLQSIAALDKQLESVSGYPKFGIIEADDNNKSLTSRISLSDAD